jgi:serine/threonine protein kinase
MEHGSLETIVRDPPADLKGWDLTQKYIAIIGIAAGMQYLHGSNVIHRDLKPGNVMMDGKWEPCIGDFGLSKVTPSRAAVAMSMVGGTPIYMAPELYETSEYSIKVDVYAYGMVVYEVLTGLEPFAELPNRAAIERKVTRGERPAIPPGVLTQSVVDLIQACWAQDPDGRPTFDEVIDIFMSDEFKFPDGVDRNRINDYERRVLFQAVMFARLRVLALENRDLQRRVVRLEDAHDDLREKNRELRKRIEECDRRGVLSLLTKKERQSVVVRRSSCDPYHLLNPRSRDSYTTPATTAENWIEFSFDEKVRLSSAVLTSANDHFLKSYRLVAFGRHGDEVVFSTHSDDELSAEGAQVIRRFSRELTASSFRIEQTGPAWDGGNAFALQNVELAASGFEPGLFEAKLKDGSAGDITVRVSGEGIDSRTGKLTARTFSGRRQWIEIEFTEGKVDLHGFFARQPQRLALAGSDADSDDWDDIPVEPDGRDSFKVIRPTRRYSRMRISLQDSGDGAVELADFDLLGEYEPRARVNSS